MGEQVAARLWGHSSVARAPALQAGGREFESLCLHGIEIKLFRFKKPRVAKRSGRNTENRAAISRSNLRSKLYGTLKTEH